ESGERRVPSSPGARRGGKAAFPPFPAPERSEISPQNFPLAGRGGNVAFPPLPRPGKEGRSRSLFSQPPPRPPGEEEESQTNTDGQGPTRTVTDGQDRLSKLR